MGARKSEPADLAQKSEQDPTCTFKLPRATKLIFSNKRTLFECSRVIVLINLKMSSPNITTDENQAPRVDDLANAINDLAISGVKSETENIEWKQVAAEMEKIWEEQAIEKLTNLPNIDLPTDKLKSKLMRHQEVSQETVPTI